MSRENKYTWMSIVFVVALLCVKTAHAQNEVDDILIHYQTRASEVFDGRNPIVSGVSFSFEAKRYNLIYDQQMRKKIIDSTIAKYFYSFGELDSMVVLIEPKNSFDSLDVSYPNVFANNYTFNFFPNDTGGQNLAIGYDSHNFDVSLPVGMAIIDRERYFLKQLYLHFMAEKKIDRKSKVIRFVEHEGFVFPDSLWEIRVKSAIFSSEILRTETGITNIQIQR